MILTKSLFGLLVMMGATVEISAEGEGDCPGGWTWNPENNFCYYVSEQYAGFNVADRSCRRLSSTLTSIVSFDEYFFLLPMLFVYRQKCTFVDDCLNHWIGLRNVGGTATSSQRWTWVDGSPYSAQTTMWGPSQPAGMFYCGSLRTVDKESELIGFWREANCDKPMRYICKKLAPSK